VAASGESRSLFARLRGRPELFLGFGVTYALHVLGFAVPGNFWVFVMLMFGGAFSIRLLGAWRLRSGSPAWLGWAETVLQFALAATVISLSGWAPLLYIGFLVLVAIRLNELSGVWRSTMVLCLTAMGVIQAGIMTGVVDTYLPSHAAAGAGILTATCVGMAIRMLGVNAMARAEAEAVALRSEERFRTVIQDSWDVIVITDATGDMVFISAAVEHVMGWPEAEYRAQPDSDRYHPDDAAAAKGIRTALADGATEHRTELRLRHADGTWHWHEVLVRNLLGNPAVHGIVFNHRDISARKEREELLAHQAAHDPLTGLANRTALRDRLNAWCAVPQPVPGAVLFVDLDGFKQVNDAYGHAAGDEVLRSTARVLKECVTEADTVARLGGDEFAVLLTGVAIELDATAVAAQVTERLAALDGPGERAAVRASIGIAMCEPGRSDARELLHRADQAMYDAKRLGNHGWIVHGHTDDLLNHALR
jgi:diguanylate cyclase (GGDEF)-like protein/PAS domain S-box-containing protein